MTAFMHAVGEVRPWQSRGRATNTHPRVLTRRAYCFHSPDSLIAMAMLTRGGLHPELPRPHRMIGLTHRNGRRPHVAHRMIAISGNAVEIVFTGLCHGERRHDDLLDDGKLGERPLHAMISHGLVPALDADDIAAKPRARTVAGAHPLAIELRYEIPVTGR